MKAITYSSDTGQWNFCELPCPVIQDDHDVLVKVHACGLNPVDAKIGLWKHLVPAMNNNWVAGLDVSGEVIALGRAVTEWKIGDRVLTHGNMFRPQGGFAEYTIQDSRTLIRHPDVSAVVAAATPCAGWTAWRALHDKLRLVSTHSLLITGGAGGTGSFAIQIAKLHGVSRIVVTASAKNVGYVEQLGATDVIDYGHENVTEAVLKLTGGWGVDRGVDCVGGENARWMADCLAFEGEMVELVDIVNPSDYPNAFMKGLSFHQISIGSGHRHGDVGRLGLVRAALAFSDHLQNGRIHVPQLQVIHIQDVPDALHTILAQRTVGKIVMQG